MSDYQDHPSPFPFKNVDYAFPFECRTPAGTWFFPGMTLRDWFAGHALAGMAANDEEWSHSSWDSMASSAYMAADAMMEARK